jgi:hypothetical protein
VINFYIIVVSAARVFFPLAYFPMLKAINSQTISQESRKLECNICTFTLYFIALGEKRRKIGVDLLTLEPICKDPFLSSPKISITCFFSVGVTV